MKNALEKRGYETWMDVEKMAGSTLNAMADAVEESAAIMIIMTKQYKESDACRCDFALNTVGLTCRCHCTTFPLENMETH